jgi:transcriptional regulator with XRE-family HTH domain
MHSQAQDIIRTIREGLGMSRAEFARALGWSATTISRWESGKAQPNRLSLKIILAFGEERGVRWRPRQTLPALVAPATTLPSLDVRPVRAELVSETAPPARRPRWEAEVRFRVRVDRTEPRTRRWLGNATVGAASCAVLLLALGVFTTTAVPSALRSSPRVAAVAPIDAPAPVPRPSRAAEDAAPEAAAPVPAAAPIVVAAPEPPPVVARLEGVTLLGTVRRATFRTDDDALVVGEGEQLGDRQAVRIAGNAVQLADGSGHVQVVRLGESVELQ